MPKQDTELREQVRGILGEIPNSIFDYLEINHDIRMEWRKGDKASNFGGHAAYINNFEERITKLIKQEVDKSVNEAREKLIDELEKKTISHPEVGLMNDTVIVNTLAKFIGDMKLETVKAHLNKKGEE